MQQPHFLVRSKVRGIVLALACERDIKRFCCVAQRFTVRDVGCWQGGHSLRQIAQNLREQRIVEMHANGLAHVFRADAMQAERNSRLVEVGVEARRSLEGPDISLSGYSTATSALSGIDLVIAQRPSNLSRD